MNLIEITLYNFVLSCTISGDPEIDKKGKRME